VSRASHVIVIGAGIVGCAVAHELARRGARVQVLDSRDVGQGATQASAGVLAPYIEAYERTPLLELCVRSLARYDEFVARAVEDSGMAVQYARTGTLEVALDEPSLARLDGTAAAYASAGILERLDARTARDVEPQLSPKVLGGLLVRPHGFVAASELTEALRRAASAHGVSFSMSTSAARILAEGEGVRVEASGVAFSAEAAVLAAGSWSGQIDVVGAAALPIRPIRGQLIHFEWAGPPLGRVVWGPRCYLVPWSDGSLLCGATVEDVGFDERATVSGVRELLDAVCELTPAARQAWFRTVRVGLRPGTPDNLPVIGPSQRLPRLIYASGHFRNGILLAPLTATVVGDLQVDGRRDPALEVTSPARFGEY